MILGLLQYLWALPNSALALPPAVICLLRGGHARWVCGVLEVEGPFIASILRRLPIAGGAAAVTIGHVVFGLSPAALEFTRAHERVHVAQYERWGPLFLPAYAWFSAWAWMRGRDPYRANRFEREAYGDA